MDLTLVPEPDACCEKTVNRFLQAQKGTSWLLGYFVVERKRKLKLLVLPLSPLEYQASALLVIQRK